MSVDIKDTLIEVGKDLVKPTGEPPVNFCGNCGRQVKHVWFNEKMMFLKRRDGEVEIPGWNQVPCECLKSLAPVDVESVYRERMRRSGIGRRFVGRSFDDYAMDFVGQSEVLELSENYAMNFNAALDRGTWLFFVGNPGTGKTFLSCLIAQAVIKAGYSALYVKAREIFRRVKESWCRDSDEKESEILSELKAVDLLIIDELGVQFGSDAERGILYDVLDGRYEDMKPLIATTNRDFDELSVVMGEHNLDRFNDSTSDSRIVVFDWASRRNGKADV